MDHFPSFQMRRALLAFGSEAASKGTRTRAARCRCVVAFASIAHKDMCLVAVGPKDAMMMAYSDGDRSHCSAKAAVHGRPGALRSADMHDTSRALLQAASGSHSGLPQKHGQAPKRRTGRVEQARMHVREKPRGGRTPRCRHWYGRHLCTFTVCAAVGRTVLQSPAQACAPLACIEDWSGAAGPGGPSGRAAEPQVLGAARTARGSAPWPRHWSPGLVSNMDWEVGVAPAFRTV